MTKTRVTAITVTFCLATVYVLAMVRVCDVFADVPGYDRCRIPSFEGLIPFLLIAVLPTFALPLRPTAGNGIIWVVYFMHVFGAVAAAPFVAELTTESILFSLFVSLSFIVVSLISNLVQIPFIKIEIMPAALYGFYLLILSLSILYLNINFKVSLSLPSIYDVYNVREEFIKNITESESSVGGYIIIMSSYSFVPVGILISYMVYRKSVVLSFIYLLLSITIVISVYSVAAFKSSAFVFVMVSGIYIFIGGHHPLRRVMLLFLFISIFALILDLGNIHHDSLIHWFRRVFIVPGLNVQYYLSEFGFFNKVSVPDAPLLISQAYFGTNGSANAGIYGNGLARGGWRGIFFVLFVFLVILVCVNSICRRIPLRISMSLLFPSAYALSNSSITTVLLSYGLIANFIFLYGLANVYQTEKRGHWFAN